MLQNEMKCWPTSVHPLAICVLSQRYPFHPQNKQNPDQVNPNQFQFGHEQGTSGSSEMGKRQNSMVQLASSRSVPLMTKFQLPQRTIYRLQMHPLFQMASFAQFLLRWTTSMILNTWPSHPKATSADISWLRSSKHSINIICVCIVNTFCEISMPGLAHTILTC